MTDLGRGHIPPSALRGVRSPFDERLLYRTPTAPLPARLPRWRLRAPLIAPEAFERPRVRAAIDAILMGSIKSNASNTITSDSATTTNGTSKFLVGVTWDASTTITGGVPSDSKSNTWVAVGAERTVNGGKQRWFITTTKLGGSSHTITVAFSGTAYPTISCFEITSAGAVDIATDSEDTGGMPITMASGTFASQPQVLLALVSNYTGTDGAYTVNSTTPAGTLMTSQSDLTNYWAHGTAKYAITSTTSFSPSLNRANSGGGSSNIHLISIEQASGGTAYTMTMGQGTYTLSGQAVGLKAGRKEAIGQGTYTLTGQAVALHAARRMTMTQGSYALTGQAVTLRASHASMAMGQGTYSITGQAVVLRRGYSMGMGQGTYTLIGADVLADYSISCTPGSYTLTGQGVTLRAARTTALAQGSYALTGQAVGLRRGYPLAAEQGLYALTGQAVALRASRRAALEAGSYVLSGQAVAMRRGLSMAAAQGTYTLTGIDVGLRGARTIVAAQGSYTLSGQAVALDYSGAAAALQVETGLYVLTGQDVALRARRALGAAAGIYSLTGQAVGLGAARTLAAQPGAYALAGQSIGLVSPARITIETGFYALTGIAVGTTYGSLSAPQAPIGSGGDDWPEETEDREDEDLELAIALITSGVLTCLR